MLTKIELQQQYNANLNLSLQDKFSDIVADTFLNDLNYNYFCISKRNHLTGKATSLTNNRGMVKDYVAQELIVDDPAPHLEINSNRKILTLDDLKSCGKGGDRYCKYAAKNDIHSAILFIFKDSLDENTVYSVRFGNDSKNMNYIKQIRNDMLYFNEFIVKAQKLIKSMKYQ